MWQSWHAKERFFRTLFFVLAVSIFGIMNLWSEAASKQQRRDMVEGLVEAVRAFAVEGVIAVGEIRDEWLRMKLEDIEVRHIPLLLEAVEREVEPVSSMLAQLITEIGKLDLPSDSWTTAAEWKLLWNERVRAAGPYAEQILGDRRLAPQQQTAQLIRIGAPVMPHLIEHLDSKQPTSSASEAVRYLLGSDTEGLPSGDDLSEWRRWARRNKDQFMELRYTYDKVQ